jgi:glycosyltransferase involved in cell wall biosynthesis
MIPKKSETPNPKILYVIGTLEVGGAETHLVRIALGLKARGWQPEFFVLQPGGPLTAPLREAGIPIHGVDCKWCRKLPKGKTLSQLFLTMGALILTMQRLRPVTCHFFLPMAYLFGGLASVFTFTRPRIMSRRSLNDYQRGHPIYAAIERWLHPKMDLVCGNSLAVVNQLGAEGVPPERERLIYNGIELSTEVMPDHREETRAALGVPAGSLVLAIVANLIPYKGHTDLIDALALVANKMPSGWTLLCMGRDDGIGKDLRERAAKAGIGENIRWLGSRRDVPQILAASDIGLLTSHQEGFSNAVLESMAAGLPMVVTDVGGNAEAVVDGDTGRVVPPHDPQALAEAIWRVATDPERRLMGERGRDRVQRFFSLNACVDAYEALYREVITPSLTASALSRKPTQRHSPVRR